MDPLEPWPFPTDKPLEILSHELEYKKMKLLSDLNYGNMDDYPLPIHINREEEYGPNLFSDIKDKTSSNGRAYRPFDDDTPHEKVLDNTSDNPGDDPILDDILMASIFMDD